MSESLVVYMVASRVEGSRNRAASQELLLSCISLQSNKGEAIRIFSEAYDRALAALPTAPYLPDEINE